jgi:hypothetical protein
MTTITSSDASNATVDSASVISGSLITSSDTFNSTVDVAGQSESTGRANNIEYAAAIPGSLPGTFTTYGLNNSNHAGSQFYIPGFEASLPTTLPFVFDNYCGPANGPLSPNYITEVGWELKVFSGNGYNYMTTIPRYQSLSFNFEVSNEGSGQLVIDRNDPIFTQILGTGGPGTDLMDYENFWQCLYNGEPVFEFLGTTIDEVFVDASSEQQPITISGAGTGRCLSWACTQPPGFPNVVYKLAALTDTFQLTEIDTQTWNLTRTADITAGNVYVDLTNSAAAVNGSMNSFLTSPALSAGYYNASSSALSAQITPLNMPNQPANLVANGSFTLGISGWDTGSSVVQAAGAIATLNTTESYQDSTGYSASVVTSAINQGIEQTVPALQPNTNYTMTAWVYQSVGSPTIQIKMHDSTNSVASFPTTTIETVGQWNLIQCSILTGAHANVNLICSINTGSAVNSFLVDNVNLFSFTPYTSSAMILYSQSDPNDYVMMELDFFNPGSHFWAQIVTDGSTSSVTLASTYDTVEHMYWRVREYSGIFYFDSAPDGSTWTNMGSLPHSWSTAEVSVSFTTWYHGAYGATPDFTPMEISNINSSSSTPIVQGSGSTATSVNEGSTASGSYNLNSANLVGLQNAYIEIPNAALWLDLLKQSQTRGTIPFINPTFSVTADSAGTVWTDQASLVISNGSDLETQLEASVTAFNGDWVMYPGFQLYVGNDGILGNNLSSDIIFYSSGHIVDHERTRVRDQVYNYIVASDGTGNLTYQTSPTSTSQWTQRENFVQSSQATDIGTLQQMAAAAIQEFQSETAQRTLTVPPKLPGRTVFVDYQLGDWIGVQNPNLSTIDSVRVVGIAISIDGTQDYVTMELTLETRIQLLIERMNVLLQKIGANADAQVIAAPGAVSQFIQQSINQTAVNTYTQVLGDGSTTSFYIGHGLGTQNVTVTLRNNSTGTMYYPQTAAVGASTTPGLYNVISQSLNQVEIVFSTALPPTVNEYTIVIKS